MDVLEAIRQRRSVRSFEDRPVEPEKIDNIIDAARWAPSPANSQPWEFIIISGAVARQKLYELSEQARTTGNVEIHGYTYIRSIPAETIEQEERPQEEREARRYSLAFLKQVPTIIAVVGLPEVRIRAAATAASDGYKFACAAAIQNMLLAAHAQGLGSLWFTYFDQTLVRQYLNVEAKKHLLALVCVGYPVLTPAPPGRIRRETKIRHFD